MSNFEFMPIIFANITASAEKAEKYIYSDPRAACFHARFALESIVHWLYRFDPSLNMPYDDSLGSLLHERTFRNLVPEQVFQKARIIQKQGNRAVHNSKPVEKRDSYQLVKELHHICFWITRTYAPDSSVAGAGWKDERIPKAAEEPRVQREELERLTKTLIEQNKKVLNQHQEKDELNSEIQSLRLELEQTRKTAQTIPDDHDYDEAETRQYIIDVDLRKAGWKLQDERDREYEVTGMPNNKEIGYVDYVLWGDDGKPLGLVEAKKTTADAAVGKQQAKLYADCLETMHGQRPLIFYTNGYETWLWDDSQYPPRQVAGFYKKDELESLIIHRSKRQNLDVANIKDEITNRYYQKRAIGNIFTQLASSRRKALLVMATGTGKTRTAISLVDVLQRSGWVKRALFLADRVSLVNQAANAFKKHLPDSSPVNLVTEKNQEGRVYVCTYPTMMGLIDQTREEEARFGVGYFDLVIIDEAHRSVYQKYKAIFQYFDSFLIGLTATPREEVDKNTYDLFELEPGVPTDAYELETAVKDGFLVPPKVQQVDLKFPQKGIKYDNLSEEEKRQWESMDWGDDAESEDLIPKEINAAAVNKWLFNKDTVDKVLMHLMQNGHTVSAGDRLGKTIIFARNHDHAVFIEERFNHHYPHYHGNFARIIDNYATYTQSLIDDFSILEKEPHIAISVDMLDTGIDVPEVLNLVFFKPVYSKIKFWQMIGRGTRLCENLFGPDDHKQDFRIFDFCLNFDFFKENPEGLGGSTVVPLGAKLFQGRVELLHKLQNTPELTKNPDLKASIKKQLHGEVTSMNRDNFIVRMHLEAVERFQKEESWQSLSNGDVHTLQKQVALLPSEIENEKIETKLFDLTSLRMQLAVAEGNMAGFENLQNKVIKIAGLLEDKANIPAVKAQMDYIQAIQTMEFWQYINLELLEELRLRIRDLVPLIDKKKKKLVYSDFKDQVMSVREQDVVLMPKMTGAQYEKKVKDYLKSHLDNIVIHKLRMNEPLTKTDLSSLEELLTSIGENEGENLLNDLLERQGSPSIAYFVRTMVGLDRAAAQAAFSTYLSDRSLTSAQIRFIEMIIDQLTANGVMKAEALYEAPFTNLHAGGPEGLFAGKDNVVNGLFEVLRKMDLGEDVG